MREFFRNLFAGLLGIITWPFRWLGFGGGNNAGAQHEAEAAEKDSRLDAVKAAVAPDAGLEDALGVRRAARAMVRGEVASGQDIDMTVRRWLHSLRPVELAFVARAQPDVLARVMAGDSVDACPVPPFVRSQCDGSEFVARLKADLAAGRGVRGDAPQPAQPRPLPFGPSLTRTIRTAAANRP